MLGIEPSDFWELSPAEYNIKVSGYSRHEEKRMHQQYQMLAQHAIWTLAPHMRKDADISVSDLVPPLGEEKEKKHTTQDDLEYLKQKMGYN